MLLITTKICLCVMQNKCINVNNLVPRVLSPLPLLTLGTRLRVQTVYENKQLLKEHVGVSFDRVSERLSKATEQIDEHFNVYKYIHTIHNIKAYTAEYANEKTKN